MGKSKYRWHHMFCHFGGQQLGKLKTLCHMEMIWLRDKCDIRVLTSWVWHHHDISKMSYCWSHRLRLAWQHADIRIVSWLGEDSNQSILKTLHCKWQFFFLLNLWYSNTYLIFQLAWRIKEKNDNRDCCKIYKDVG